ncbi:MAG: envelope stress response membrane protein PspC [Alphaproteobacteria bacterium]|nr:envelope stress response membrane protein PspC [Alphaproteobacteria bacterium]HPF46854.1 envelope stress response membrane protein PspC [Emcibacteraceae bacterium]HRW29186.1 envelope stress response membrane protein PspC [Emcibacteraceae bacterium]
MYRHPHTPPYKKLYLDKKNAKISGVCAGLGDYFGIKPKILRIAAILGSIFFGFIFFVIGYVLLAYFLDEKPENIYESKKESDFWNSVRTEPSNTVRDIRYKFRDIERRLRAAEAHVTSPQYNLSREIDNLDK